MMATDVVAMNLSMMMIIFDYVAGDVYAPVNERAKTNSKSDDVNVELSKPNQS